MIRPALIPCMFLLPVTPAFAQDAPLEFSAEETGGVAGDGEEEIEGLSAAEAPTLYRDEAFMLGMTLIADSKAREALPKLEDARSRFPDEPDVALYLGRAHEQLGAREAALREYEAYLAGSPNADNRPIVELSIQRLRAELESPDPELVIESDPPQAAVFVPADEEVARGRTPFAVKLSPGTHRVRVARGGYQDEVRTVVLTEGQRLDLKVDLSPAEGTPMERLSTPAPAQPVDVRDILGWSAIGLGAVAVGVGVHFSLEAADTVEEAEALRVEDQDRWPGLQDDLDGEQALSWLGYGVGAALVGTGVVLLLLEDAPPGRAGVHGTPTGVGARF